MDEKIRLLLDVNGIQDVQELRDRLAEVKQRLDQSRGSYVAGSDDAKRHAAEIKALAREYGQLGGALQKLEGTGKQGLAGFGQLTQGVGRFVQDFQAAGLNGVVNNLEQLGGGMAKVAGLAPGWGALIGGALQLAGVMALVATPWIQEFFGALFKGADGVEGAANKLKALEDRIKELTEKPNKVAMDYSDLEETGRRYEKLRKDAEAFDALDKQRTQAQKETADSFNKAIAEHAGGDDAKSGAQRTKDAILMALRDSGQDLVKAPEFAAKIEEQEDLIKDMERLIAAAPSPMAVRAEIAAIPRIRKEIDDLREQAGKKLGERGGYADSLLSPTEKNRAELERLARQQPGAFRRAGINPDEFAEQLHLGSPEAQEEYKKGLEADLQYEADQAAETQRWDQAKARAAKKRKELEALFAGAAKELGASMRQGLIEGKVPKEVEDVFTEQLKGWMANNVEASERTLDRVARKLIRDEIGQIRKQGAARMARDFAETGEMPDEVTAQRELQDEDIEKRGKPGEAKRKKAQAEADAAQRKKDLAEDRIDREREAANKENLKRLQDKIKESDDALYGGDVDERATAALAGIRGDPTLTAAERNARMKQWRGQVGREAYRDMRDRGLSEQKARHFAGQAADVYEGNFQLQLEQLRDQMGRVPGGVRGVQLNVQSLIAMQARAQAELDSLRSVNEQQGNQIRRMQTRQHR